MYRCVACDTPSQLGHMAQCAALFDTMNAQEEQERPINIASGEDANFEVM
jgi:hypothetical protein